MKSGIYRRSEYGSRPSALFSQIQDFTSTNRKLLHSSVTDRIKYKFQNTTNNFDDDISQALIELIAGNTWNLYKVSHLYNLCFTSVKLKQYATRIKQELTTNLEKRNDGVHFDVKVVKIPVLKNNDKCFALKIEVYLSNKTKENVLKLQSILLSWGEYTIDNNLSHLPFLMCMGAVNITRLVNTAICEIFDTTIRPLQISEDDIMWLSTMVNDSDNNEDVCYEYRLNDSILKHDISVSFPNKVIKKLWDEIHPPHLEEINFQQVQEFHKHIQCQLIVTYGINFELLRLHKISVGNTVISCEGKIKMTTYDAVVKILSFINDISILLDTCCPTISNSF